MNQFSINIVPKVSQNAQIGQLFSNFEQALQRRIAMNHVDGNDIVDGIIFFPRVADPGLVGTFPNVNSFKRTEKCIFVGVSIDFYKWREVAEGERVNMISGNLIESVDYIKNKSLEEKTRQQLISAIKEAEGDVLIGLKS